ncbi:hypothetical protein LPC08_14410 [Roseomonas sp. OT10]|uniref:glycosyltransferase family 2 protein n=1 Tax=Roseomonas cutis TaxID=2897332 RepID=UPI001E5D76D7|nr:hypothetical protein [Roseomonas sp. OT10]UFN47219.1 hypothetical protein LPC08_14410 [Roseomonas sp. OT10]
MSDRPNTAAHLIHELATSADHCVVQRWIALAPEGRGRYDLPSTEMVVTVPTPKFVLLDELTEDAAEYDWVLLCDDDIEVGPGFLDRLIGLSERFGFALSQPARTADSFTDHPIVQVMPGLLARRTRFVEIGPLTCIRRDAVPLLLPFGEGGGMGWGLDFIWPVRMEKAGLHMGIVDAAPLTHRIRRSVSSYSHSSAYRAMCTMLAREQHLSLDEAFSVVEAYA